jgi:hypothetical protein
VPYVVLNLTRTYDNVKVENEPRYFPTAAEPAATTPANFRVLPYRQNPRPDPPKFEAWPAHHPSRWTEPGHLSTFDALLHFV